MNKKLINFRAPNDLRQTFDLVCRFKSRNRSQILIELMRQFVEANHQTVITQANALKDIDKTLSEFIQKNNIDGRTEFLSPTKSDARKIEINETQYLYPFYKGENR
jgi:hypothetical protein